MPSAEGYRRHVALDLHTKLILAVVVASANEREKDGLAPLLKRLKQQRIRLASINFDRGYIESEKVPELIAANVEIVCKPWRQQNGDKFNKTDFALDFEEATVTCPAGQKQPLVLGQVTRFEPQACDTCTLKSRCTTSERGRSLRIAEDEPLQAELRARMATPEGRAQLRQRVSVEHTLAHVSQQQGNRARYMGKRKNEYDLHRTAVVVNLQTVQRELEGQMLANAA